MSEGQTALLMDGLFGEGFFDRRRSPRRKSGFADVLICDQSMLNFWQGHVLNCSPEGIGLRIQDCKPAVGAILYVRRPSSASLNASIAVQVVHCQRYDRESYVAGCSFLEQPTPQTLVLFG